MPKRMLYVSKETQELEQKILRIAVEIVFKKGEDATPEILNKSALYKKALLLLQAQYLKELEELTKNGVNSNE